ncbi:NAD(P)-binding protein [Schizophyllum commune H4-8]|uniref:NAD(P)-binding protein n=1 Tax=Schizophyllum commune (strain H4-8 / FGSC 9210) TaxID=578458 RepID=D8QAH0_SCHCM|nr:NAD(P)-binding protein [Schizophyllum commune H4-8]KAI5890002.1 NAD(P)-binding protein [Schizophyllum commune H4-8]
MSTHISSTVYLVSGATRGIGLAFVTLLAERPDTIVFAGARDPATASNLQALAKKHPNNVFIVELKASDVEGNTRAIEQIRQNAGRLDVVIANAAIQQNMEPLVNVTLDTMREHYDTNVIGTLVLFQAAYPLLKTSPTHKFIVMGAKGGSITNGPEYGILVGAYGCTKAAVHYLAKKLQFENEDFVIFPICPGAVDTDMFRYAQERDSRFAQVKGAAPEEAAASILKIVDNATRENAGGKFMDVSGGINDW